MRIELREAKILPNNKDCLQFFLKLLLLLLLFLLLLLKKIFWRQSLLFGKIFASLRHGKSIRMTPPEGGYPASSWKLFKMVYFNGCLWLFALKPLAYILIKKYIFENTDILLFFIIFISFFRWPSPEGREGSGPQKTKTSREKSIRK